MRSGFLWKVSRAWLRQCSACGPLAAATHHDLHPTSEALRAVLHDWEPGNFPGTVVTVTSTALPASAVKTVTVES